MRKYIPYCLWLLLAVSFCACALVDEDMRACKDNYKINYELRLVTNISTEIQTQISTSVELTSVATALQEYLRGIFTDFAHDIDLSFYDVQGDSLRLHHEVHIMDASERSYTLSIPVRRYMHLAAANLDGSDNIRLQNDEKCHTSVLWQDEKKVLDSFKTGIFTARLPMEIKENVDQHFEVKLSITNCASALVLDTLGSGIRDLRVYMSGFANGFNLADSLYIFKSNPLVVADEVNVSDGRFTCFCAVTFPSREVDAETKVIIDTDDPYVSPEAEETLWKCTVYATTEEGSTTESVLGVKLPLRPGQFKLIRAKVYDDGSVRSQDPYVGASVTLDWNEQPPWEIIL